MTENKGFTERAIARLQRQSIHDGLFAQTLHAYLRQRGRIAYDDERNLFWVVPPSGPAQVALWLMPATMEPK